MSKNYATDNIYNILNTLKSLEPTSEQTVQATARRIYESVEAQGSITAGVGAVEARLREKFAEGMTEGHADQQRKIFKKNGKPVGEVGIDPEASPGNGNWYVKHYASGYDVVGFDSYEEAVAELKYCMEQGVAEDVPTQAGGVDPKIQFLQPTIQFAEKQGYRVTLNPQGRVVAELVNKQLGHTVHIGLFQPSSKGFEVSMADNLDWQTNAWSAKELARDFKGWHERAVKDQDFNNGYSERPQLEQHGVAEGLEAEDLGTVAEINQLIAKGMHETDAIHAVAKKYGDDPGELSSFYYQNNRMREGAESDDGEEMGDDCSCHTPGHPGYHGINPHCPIHGKEADPDSWAVAEESAKPDYIDLDNDGNKKETMKQAAKDRDGVRVHKGTYGTSYDPSDEEKKTKTKHVPKTGQKGRPRAEKPMDAKSAPRGDIFGRTTGDVPKGKKGARVKGKDMVDESNNYKKQNFMLESFNFANMMKETNQTVEEMLTELQSDIHKFKMTGECSPKLDAFLRVHGHNKKQLADEAKAVPNYEVPAVQRKVAGEPPLSLGDVHAHDTNRSMHPSMTRLDAPKPAHHHIHDELDELAQLAGITDEGNAFTGKLAKTAHGDSFELDGNTYKDTSKLDEAMCNECGMYESQCSCTEGNLFTKKLAQTPKGGEFELDGKQYKDTSNLDETSMKLEDIAKLAGIAVEGKDYGDTSFNPAPTYDNTPEEVVYGEDVLLKGGDGEMAGMEKAQHPNKPTFKNGDNPLAKTPMESREFDPLESMGRRLMKQYESIKLQK